MRPTALVAIPAGRHASHCLSGLFGDATRRDLARSIDLDFYAD